MRRADWAAGMTAFGFIAAAIASPCYDWATNCPDECGAGETFRECEASPVSGTEFQWITSKVIESKRTVYTRVSSSQPAFASGNCTAPAAPGWEFISSPGCGTTGSECCLRNISNTTKNLSVSYSPPLYILYPDDIVMGCSAGGDSG
jgi:hypothetical protein